MKNVKKEMSWIPDEHKRLYSQAFSALYQDVKATSSSIINKSKELAVNGYETIKKYYHDDPNGYDDWNCDSDSADPNVYDDSWNYVNTNLDNNSADDNSNFNIKIAEMGDFYPDVLVILHREKHYLCKIYVIDDKGHKISIKGRISSYRYIHNIINKWFIYQKFESGYKWLPTEELYTAYRESSSMLSPIDNILFRYGRNEYYPQRYHPLI